MPRELGVAWRATLAATLVVVGVGFSFAAATPAERRSTPAEHQALAAAAGMPPECVETWISDVDPAWAEMHATNVEDCPTADGVVVWQLTGGAWTAAYQGPASKMLCPLDGVPTPVARDFGLCVRKSRRVYAIRGDRLVVRPRRLIQGAHGVYERLRWRRWGTWRAVARGRLHYVDAYDEFRAPVRITLSRIRICGLNRRTYVRQTVRAARKRDRARLRFTTGTIRLRCP